MKNILASGCIGILEQYACWRVVVGFDFDGTLAPIVADRGAAVMRQTTRTLLKQVCERYPCALLTGRSRKDAAARVERVGFKHVVGNHGIERGEPSPQLATAGIAARLRDDLGKLQGVEIEDKRYSVSIHYRQSRTRQMAMELIQVALRALGPAIEVVPGKLVVNVLPAGAPTKGDALAALVRQEQATAAIYVGDDVTDETVFALRTISVLGIRVGESDDSAAKYYVRDQNKVDELLVRLVSIRGRRAGA